MTSRTPPLPTDVQNWHPKIRRLHEYWCAIHPDRALPGRRHFDPAGVPDLLPNIWLVEIESDPFNVRFRLAGTHFCRMFGREFRGLSLDAAFPDLPTLPELYERFRTIVATKRPIWRNGPPVMNIDRHWTTIELIMLPLAGDGAHVDMVLCLSIWCGPNGAEL